MRKISIAALEGEIRELKQRIAPEMICVAVLTQADSPGVFILQESIYRGRHNLEAASKRIHAATLAEAIEWYSFPDGCDEDKSILISVDYGEQVATD